MDNNGLILFYDTETTGFPMTRVGLNDPKQPHLVQLAGLLMDEDRNPVQEVNVIIRPDGYEIPTDASDVHGITTEQALKDGIPLWQAVWLFDRMLAQASLRVAHNKTFDDKLLAIAYCRLGMSEAPVTHKGFCTMQATTDICKLPGRYGDYKWPKLIEAYRHFFKEDFDDAHDAMADVKACAAVYYAVQDLKGESK